MWWWRCEVLYRSVGFSCKGYGDDILFHLEDAVSLFHGTSASSVGYRWREIIEDGVLILHDHHLHFETHDVETGDEMSDLLCRKR